MTGDLHRGEDLAQEAFLRVFTRRQDYQPRGKFSTWLWQIALNLCRDDARYQRRHPVSSWETTEREADEAVAMEPESRQASPDTDVARLEQAEIVRKALQQLDEPFRAVVILRHYEGLKFAEIAEILGIPEGTVKSRLTEALNRLAPHLLLLRTA
jgi:RNA polymerase sigma-70 factor (ECF subfamily)